MEDARSSRIAVIIVIVLVLLALCCCCVIAATYLESETRWMTDILGSAPLVVSSG